jgi:prepilin-type N-terminal cleavage/methylation domain-containing protein
MNRPGFSLVEILVATGIFAMVSVAMIGIYSTATELVRLGESRRAAADEAVATLAMLDDDLARITPPEAGGFFLAQMPTAIDLGWDPGGSMAVAFTISDREQATTRTTTARPQRLVLWMTDRRDRLWRCEEAAPVPGQRFSQVNSWFATIANLGDTPDVPRSEDLPPMVQPVAQGCLLLSVGVVQPGVTNLQPAGNEAWITEKSSLVPDTKPFPEALRISLAFNASGALVQRGRLIPTGTDTFRLSGLKNIGSGSWLRVTTTASPVTVEWIRANPGPSGIFTRDVTQDMEKWRTARHPDLMTLRGSTVQAPVFYSLTRSIGR